MKRLRIISHGPSDSLNLLLESLRTVDGLDVKKLKRNNSTYRYREDDVLFNYGCSSRRNLSPTDSIFNKPESVAIASNKLETFHQLPDEVCVEWTISAAIAKKFLRNGAKVYCRTLLQSSQGNGIIVANSEEELVAAPLYTIGYPHLREVRVHVFAGEVIHWGIKKKMNHDRLEEEGLSGSQDIRNLENGWIFAREGEVLWDIESNRAIGAVTALGLDYGAVDLVSSINDSRVLEVNTAPGMQGSTLEAYKTAILRICGDDYSFSV